MTIGQEVADGQAGVTAANYYGIQALANFSTCPSCEKLPGVGVIQSPTGANGSTRTRAVNCPNRCRSEGRELGADAFFFSQLVYAEACGDVLQSNSLGLEQGYLLSRFSTGHPTSNHVR